MIEMCIPISTVSFVSALVIFKCLASELMCKCFADCRFYSHNSSFVHGGVEKPGEEQPPVMGQAVCITHVTGMS